MRIIDKNTDFYDYLQDPTDTLVFDRRGSFLLEKEDVCRALGVDKNWNRNEPCRFILLQCGATFWLFLAYVTGFDSWSIPTDYELELLYTWRNINKSNELLKVDVVDADEYKMRDDKTHMLDRELIRKYIKDSVDYIDRNSSRYYSIKNMNHSTKLTDYKCGHKKEIQTIPILRPSGMGKLINPQEIFSAIEEYFSIEKTKLETTEPKGATNDDKIIMHGFDTKTSFRGKR
jgi:hypothetical protein